MALSLVERLMGLDATGLLDAPASKIPVHAFFAACNEIVATKLTAAQVKTLFGMDATTSTEFDALVALAPGTQAGQALFVERIHGVFILAEGRFTGYSTPALVRATLGI